jgi:hypothetical protein
MQPPTYRIAQPPKTKNPINCSVVLALGESNNKRLKPIKSSPVVRQDHTEIYGVLNWFRSSDATQTVWIIHIFPICQTIQALTPSIDTNGQLE